MRWVRLGRWFACNVGLRGGERLWDLHRWRGYCIVLWQLERFSIPNPATVIGTATMFTIDCVVWCCAASSDANSVACPTFADYAHTVCVVLGA
jgi:hypothetical protein